MILWFAQLTNAQIILDYSNSPSIEQCQTTDSFTTVKVKSLPTIEVGLNQVWDFSSASDSANIVRKALPVSGNAGFPSATFKTEIFYSFSQLRYDGTLMYNVTPDGIEQYGVHIDKQAIPLKGMTGGSKDSLIFIQQDVKYSSPGYEVKFPTTFGDKWTDSYSFKTHFNLTVALFGLDNVPGERRTLYTVDNEVVGWGQMIVNDKYGKPTKPIDVLMIKTTETSIDSFYLAGAPAPAQLLGAFGLTQNQIDRKYSYSFNRGGEHYGLAIIEYNDNSFNQPALVAIHQLRLGATNSIQNNMLISDISIFPNPVCNNTFHIKVNGLDDNYTYWIYDIVGKVVELGKVNSNGVINLEKNNPTGTYFIKLKSQSGNYSINQFQIIR